MENIKTGNDMVSIIMPSYNTAEYIGQAIESVLKQTYYNWELIIVDDYSNDRTNDIILQYNDKRILYFKNEKNLGAAISRNRALKQARGQWIAFLDSDDLWDSDKLEKQIEFMQSNHYCFSYTSYDEIDENGYPIGIYVTGPRRITKRKMYNFCWPGCLTVMYDKNIVGDIQIPSIKKNNDYLMWIKIVEKADCYLLNENLAHYRIRKGSISNSSYFTLIQWHYKMWRLIHMNSCLSIIMTVRNLMFGVYKKFKYYK
jgi:glycosyltransferase involved in cell wall biosynthesis